MAATPVPGSAPLPPDEAAPPRDKSVALAFVLTLFLGPFGLMYVTVPGGLALLVLAAFGVVTHLITSTLAWVISIVWCCVVSNQRHKVFRQWLEANSTLYPVPVGRSATAPPDRNL